MGFFGDSVHPGIASERELWRPEHPSGVCSGCVSDLFGGDERSRADGIPTM